jgi:hypothetical protein
MLVTSICLILLLFGGAMLFGGAIWIDYLKAQRTQKIKITKSPTLAEFNELKARVTELEKWAIRHGGKF